MPFPASMLDAWTRAIKNNVPPPRCIRGLDAALRAAYERLIAAGVQGLHYLPGEHLLGDDGEDTVDSSHPTDLGFMRQADAFAAALKPLLE